MKYFCPPYNVESINAQYKTLAKRFHPDRGGNENEFKEMQAEKTQLLDALNKYPAPIKKPRKTKKKRVQVKHIHVVIDANRIINNWLNKIL